MRWTETVIIDAPADVVRTAVRDQRQVMAWSAWPEATGYTCSVEGDATSVGSQIVFRDRTGTVQGRQRIVEVTHDGDTHTVAYDLDNRGPFGRTLRPRVDFRTTAVEGGRTEVALDFAVDIPFPPPLRQVVGVGMRRWVRGLHRRDLDQLKAHIEAAGDPRTLAD
jgi:hypothetical protein